MAKAEAVIGHVPGVEVGRTYAGRKEAMEGAMHRNHGAGIDFDARSRLTVAIALNEGYPDDLDLGDEIIYTGEGGQNARREQVRDQEFTKGNDGLRNSHRLGSPVRVLRGWQLSSGFGPTSGYRYDGLYAVTEVWRAPGRHRFQICRFKLEAVPGNSFVHGGSNEFEQRMTGDTETRRTTSVVTRLIRDTTMSRAIKELHSHCCQVCGATVDLPGGRYSEGAHIIPLGRPHGGPDTAENLLCLCPNDHVRLDNGAISIEDDWTVRCTLTGAELGRLRTEPGHQISREAINYHRERIVT